MALADGFDGVVIVGYLMFAVLLGIILYYIIMDIICYSKTKKEKQIQKIIQEKGTEMQNFIDLKKPGDARKPILKIQTSRV